MRPNASVKLPEAETHGGVDCGNDCLTREVDGASHSWRNEGDRWDAPLGGDGARSSEARLDLLLASAVRPVLLAQRLWVHRREARRPPELPADQV